MDAPAKQQIVERVKQAENILVTVSNDPSVDQLAASIGLTLLLNKLGKHATAVFSGKVPSTLEFLQPEKTLEANTDSLRDFIISLDKNKADKLRYKVEDQVVRIFITPYKTSLSEKDLVFSQGDFNVEVVIALGIKDRAHIDAAITAHGRILHDATVISINAGAGQAPDLGQINWQDPTSSSLCEMLVSISEALAPNIIDNQMATAFLTGIVAETKRFSNDKTSPKVMTIGAQLMAAGANQQLIATKLEPPLPPPPPPPPPQPKKDAPKPKPPEPPKPDTELEAKPLSDKEGVLSVSHNKDKKDKDEAVEVSSNEIHIDEEGNIKAPKEQKPGAPEQQEESPQALAAAQPPEATVEKTTSVPLEPALPAPPALPLAPVPELPNLPPPAPTPPPTTPPPPPPPIPPPTSAATEPPKEAEIPRANGRLQAAGPTLPTPPVTDEYKPHSLMDPLHRPPVFEGPFSADTGQQAWSDSYNSVPFDPLTNNSSDSGFTGSNLKNVAPSPESDANIDVDKARSAVESAYAAGPLAYEAPRQDLGAQFGPEIQMHTPPPVNTGTPSLQLPTNGAPTAPPPFPPPPFPPQN